VVNLVNAKPVMRKLMFALSCCLLPALAGASRYVPIQGGDFRSVVRYEDSSAWRFVADFALMERLVSNAEFARFIARHPHWRRDLAPPVFVSSGYLQHWENAHSPGSEVHADAPVVNVSWYAADVFCREQGARLPTFLEWEYVAAADQWVPDARGNRSWLLRHMDDGTPRALDALADAPANVYGIYGLHGATWEWSDDFSALLGSSDVRSREDGDRIQFCGASALAFYDRQHYGVQKRFALLSALKARSTLSNLGFRCARNLP